MFYWLQNVCYWLINKLKYEYFAIIAMDSTLSRASEKCLNTKTKQIIGIITLMLYAICSLIMSLLLLGVAIAIAICATTLMLIWKAVTKKYPKWWLKD